MATKRLLECSCPSCKRRYFETHDIEDRANLPPIAYQFGKKAIYSLLCSYCTRLTAAPAFTAWAEKNLASGEMDKPKRKRLGKMP